MASNPEIRVAMSDALSDAWETVQIARDDRGRSTPDLSPRDILEARTIIGAWGSDDAIRSSSYMLDGWEKVHGKK